MSEKKVPSPVTKGHVRVPVIMQMEALECGAASLAMVMAYYGKWVPLEQVRLDCGVSRDGSNARNVLAAARNYGFEAQGYRCEVDSLRENIAKPCIIHWNFNHFVVLDGFKGDYAYINDPARGEVKVPLSEFDTAFTGICLEIKPGRPRLPALRKAEEHPRLRRAPAEGRGGGGRLRAAFHGDQLSVRDHQPRLLPLLHGPPAQRREPGAARALHHPAERRGTGAGGRGLDPERLLAEDQRQDGHRRQQRLYVEGPAASPRCSSTPSRRCCSTRR